MKLSRIFIVPLILLFLTFSVGAQDVQESLDPFSELAVFSGLEVEVIPSGENRIEITGHSKNEVKFSIADNRLEVRLKLSNLWSKDNTQIRIHSSTLETIDANQGSLVEVTDVLEGEELTFRAQEGSNIRTRVNSRKINSKVVTGGKIRLEGKTIEQLVEINTGGHFYGRDLRTDQTEIRTGTAGRGEVYATEYVKASASLGGTVEIFGRPKEIDTKTSLGGRIF